MDLQYITFGEVTRDMARDIIHTVDSVCFPVPRMTAAREMELFQANEKTMCICCVDGKPVGYIHIFPLAPAALEGLKNGWLQESGLTACHVAPFVPGRRCTYLIDALAVLPVPRSVEIQFRLISEATVFILSMEKEGIAFDEILAFPVNEKIVRLLRRKGWSQVQSEGAASHLYSFPREEILRFAQQRVGDI